MPTAADRARFEGRDAGAAPRACWPTTGERDLFRVFVLHLDDTLPNAEELRAAGRHGARLRRPGPVDAGGPRRAPSAASILPERGYPVRTPPQGYGAPEPALVLGIIRQESGFDPSVPLGRRRARA